MNRIIIVAGVGIVHGRSEKLGIGIRIDIARRMP